MLKYYSLMLPACQVLRGLLCLPLCLLSRLLQRERERVQGAKRERERDVLTQWGATLVIKIDVLKGEEGKRVASGARHFRPTSGERLCRVP